MIRMAFRFVMAMLRYQWGKLWGYEVIAPAEVQVERNRMCGLCPNNREGQCAACQCLILAKTMMALEECPLGLWVRVWKAVDKSSA